MGGFGTGSTLLAGVAQGTDGSHHPWLFAESGACKKRPSSSAIDICNNSQSYS
jgi:hypothetical protein